MYFDEKQQKKEMSLHDSSGDCSYVHSFQMFVVGHRDGYFYLK